MTIVYRDVKGSNLTPDEVDGNFHDLDDRVDAIENNPPEARGIAEVTQSIDGGSLTFEMTDSTTEGPFTLPSFGLVFRGEWQPTTNYSVNDIVTANGAVYLVIFAHTSEATFDPGANNGMGNDYYGLLLETPETTIPAGGGEGYVLAKNSATDYDLQWQNRGIPDGGDAGEVLVKLSDDDLDFDWAPAPFSTVVNVTGTELHPSLAQSGSFFMCSNVAGCLVSLPEHTSVAFPIGTELHFCQDGAGSVVIVGQDSDSSVVVDAPVGYEPLTSIEGAVVTAKKVAQSRWVVFGLVAAEEASDTA